MSRPWRAAWALLLCVTATNPAIAVVLIDPGACAVSVAASVDYLVNGMYDMAQAAADCTLPGLDEISCGSDITDMSAYLFRMASMISAGTLACGALDNDCSFQINRGLRELMDSITAMIGAASTCVNDPFICSYNLVTAIEKMNQFITRMVKALKSCNRISKNPGPQNIFAFYSPWSPFGDRRLNALEDTDDADAHDAVAPTAAPRFDALPLLAGAGSFSAL